MNTITLFFFIVPILALVLLVANLLLAVHRPDSEKVTPYECGFSVVFGQTRNPFSITFYLVGILFLVFDLEILLLYPYAGSLLQNGNYGFWIFVIFFFVLSLGFVYEMASGALYFTDKRSSIIKKDVVSTPFYKLKFRNFKTKITSYYRSFIFTINFCKFLISYYSIISSIHFIILLFNIIIAYSIICNSSAFTVGFINNINIHIIYYLLLICFLFIFLNKKEIVIKVMSVVIHISIWVFIFIIIYFIKNIDAYQEVFSVFPYFNHWYESQSFINENSTDIIAINYSATSSIAISNQNINWCYNNKVQEAQAVLQKMYDHMLKQEDQATFAIEHLLPLLEPLKGDTGLPINFISSESIISNSNSFMIKTEGEAVKIGNLFNNKMGIYSFTEKDFDMKNTYIGLTQNFADRIKMHYILSTRPHKHYGNLYPYIYSNGGMKNMLFNVHLLFPTYQNLWLEKYSSITPELSTILKAFSEFKIGIYEQALLDYYKPGLNSTYITQFNFKNWTEGYAKNPVSYFEMEHVPFLIKSIKADTFDFTLYYDYCRIHGIEAVDESWLQWFIGFSERRATFETFGHTKSLSFRINDDSFLSYIKESLSLTSSPFTRLKEGKQILIKGTKDIDLITTIFHKNIISDSFLDIFKNYTTSITKKVTMDYSNKPSSLVSFDNAWLSGIIDAHCTFFLEGTYPRITFNIKNGQILTAIFSLIGTGFINENKGYLKLKGDNAIKPIVDYIEKYPLKYQIDTFNWFKECLELRKQMKLNRSDSNIKQKLMKISKERPK